mmetsp:Transcript_10390/g.14668  ORF Transcript_10390/g.14668 Transcript_10390/m.14668 type:complete len:429 (-) Transcript_10390:68-1354(-)
MTSVPSTDTSMTGSGTDDDFWMPLILSTIAGLSTCLGAAVVFCHPKTHDGTKRLVSSDTMAFSLALAGSVMVTVSVISIGPECLHDPESSSGYMSIFSIPFLQRAISFAVGCLLYFGLSWFAFPEPEELVGGAVGMFDSQQQQMDDDASIISETTRASVQTRKMSNTRHGTKAQRRFNNNGSNNSDTVSISEHASIADGSCDTVALLEKGIASKSPIHRSSTPPSPTSSVVGDVSSSTNKKDDGQVFFHSLTRWSSGSDLDTKEQRRAWRVAMLLFVSLLFHNFPEGLAVAASALESEKLGITVTIGIMIHNIPEGIAISIPCLMARPDAPWLSFCLASFSGLAEPFGAWVALFFLRNIAKKEDTYKNPIMCMENVLAFVAGIMITVALYELFPEGKRHCTASNNGMFWYATGTIMGIVVMILTEMGT